VRGWHRLEGLDDEHAAAAAGQGWASACSLLGSVSTVCSAADGARFKSSRRRRDRRGAIAAGERPYGDAVEALGQDMDEEARMNSPTSSVIVVKRPGPSIR